MNLVKNLRYNFRGGMMDKLTVILVAAFMLGLIGLYAQINDTGCMVDHIHRIDGKPAIYRCVPVDMIKSEVED